MGTEAFTVRSESKKIKQLDKLASQRKRSRNYLMNEALDYYLDVQA
jgi:predicted transcriptional regulator